MIGQRDSRWSYIKLGHGVGTIGQYGCVITCVTDALNDAGYTEETPATVNEKLKNTKDAFIGTTKNLLDWYKLNSVFTIEYIGSYNYDTIAAPLNKLKEYLEHGLTVILRVSAKNIGGSGDHFIRAKAMQGDNVIVRDPWFAEEALITKRYTDGSINTAQEIILGFRVMKITKKQGETMPDDIQSLLKKYGVNTIAELDAKLLEHVGLDWGNSSNPENKSYLANGRRNEAKLAEDLKAALTKVDEWKTLYDTEKITSNARKEKYEKFLQYMCDKLGTPDDEEIIKGKLNELIAVEDKLVILNKKMEEKDRTYEQEKVSFQTQITALLTQLDQKGEEINTLKQQVKDLGESIENNNNEQAQHNKLKDIVDGILLFFEKLGADYRNKEVPKENENEKTNT